MKVFLERNCQEDKKKKNQKGTFKRNKEYRIRLNRMKMRLVVDEFFSFLFGLFIIRIP